VVVMDINLKASMVRYGRFQSFVKARKQMMDLNVVPKIPHIFYKQIRDR